MGEVGTPAAAAADANVAAVSDDPAGRLQLAAQFYGAHGGPDFRYQRAPLAFMRWEIRRGALNPVADGGSAWWRAVNGQFLRDAEEARLLLEGDSDDAPSNVAVERWIAFARQPGRSTWYAAHNSSVAMGYIDHAALAADETALEQLLIGHTITRVLFAESLEDGSALDLGPLARSPAGSGTRARPASARSSTCPTSTPTTTPCRRRTIAGSPTGSARSRTSSPRSIDDVVVSPLVPRLFDTAATRLQLAELARFVHAGAVAYPWSLLVDAEELARRTVAEHEPSAILRALRDAAHLRAAIVSKRVFERANDRGTVLGSRGAPSSS